VSDEAKAIEKLANEAIAKSGVTAGTLQPIAIVTDRNNQEERVAKLRAYFHDFIGGWLGKLVEGVRFTPGISHALAEVLLMHAAAAMLAPTPEGDKENDADTAKRCLAAVAEMMDVLERQVAS
jgi:hypothetical protein